MSSSVADATAYDPCIINLQLALQHLHLYARNITGKFDKKTESAVIAFQKQYEDLSNDGIVGEYTRNKLWIRIFPDFQFDYSSEQGVTLRWK